MPATDRLRSALADRYSIEREIIAAHLGERSRAVGLLEQALSEGANLTRPLNILQHDSLLLPLKGYPAFMELLKPVG